MCHYQDQTKSFLLSKEIPNAFAVTFTLKQNIKAKSNIGLTQINVTREMISKNIRHFSNRLNQKIFKNRYRRFGQKLRMVPVFEGLNGSKRLHVHLIIESPVNFESSTYKNLILECWDKTDFAYRHADFQQIYDYAGWVNYILKDLNQDETKSCIDIENLHL